MIKYIDEFLNQVTDRCQVVLNFHQSEQQEELDRKCGFYCWNFYIFKKAQHNFSPGLATRSFLLRRTQTAAQDRFLQLNQKSNLKSKSFQNKNNKNKKTAAQDRFLQLNQNQNQNSNKTGFCNKIWTEVFYMKLSCIFSLIYKYFSSAASPREVLIWSSQIGR